jgi:hypothetical protein
MDIETSIEYYKDNLGRMDLKPVNGKEASTNNQLLYTGELAILMELVNKNEECVHLEFNNKDFASLHQSIQTCKVPNVPGLYTRHPEPYRFKTLNGMPNFVPVSFDEILGACFINFCAGEIKANERIVQHAQLTHNRFCDIPGYELMDSYSTVFKAGLLADLKAYYQKAKTYATLETGLRKEVRNTPRLYPLFFSHSLSDLFIYNAGCGRDNSFLGSVSVFLAVFVASLKKDNLSTKVLWWYRFRFLELTGKETVLTKFAKQFYNYTNKNRLGDSWQTQLFSSYYEDKNHPFHELLKYV